MANNTDWVDETVNTGSKYGMNFSATKRRRKVKHLYEFVS
jgi:hypothetical protein